MRTIKAKDRRKYQQEQTLVFKNSHNKSKKKYKTVWLNPTYVLIYN